MNTHKTTREAREELLRRLGTCLFGAKEARQGLAAVLKKTCMVIAAILVLFGIMYPSMQEAVEKGRNRRYVEHQTGRYGLKIISFVNDNGTLFVEFRHKGITHYYTEGATDGETP